MTDPIAVECPNCFKSLKLKNDKLMGSQLKCPKCQQPFVAEVKTANGAEDDQQGFLDGVSSYDDGLDAIENESHEDEGTTGMLPIAGGRSRRKQQETSPRKIREAKLRTKKGFIGSSGLIQFIRSVVAGFIGGILGAGIWVAAVSVTGSELGYIAWVVGILTGIGIRVLGNYSGTAVGWMAAITAMSCVLIAKFAAAGLVVSQRLDSVPSEKAVIAAVANEITNEKENNEEFVAAPRTVDVGDFNVEALFPIEIWDQAKAEANELSNAARSQKESEFQKLGWKDWVFRTPVIGAFVASFAVFDILWMLFAAGSAFAISANEFGT